MGRNEIKLRRSNISEGHIARHRNYGLLMKRHHRDLRIRKLTIVLIYVLIIIAAIVLYLVVRKEEQHRQLQKTHPETAHVVSRGSISMRSLQQVSASDC